MGSSRVHRADDKLESHGQLVIGYTDSTFDYPLSMMAQIHSTKRKPRSRSPRLIHCLFAAGLAAIIGCDGFSLSSTPIGNPIPTGGISGTTPGDNGIASNASPAASEYEQLALERINRARLMPGREAERYGIAVDEGVPGQIDSTPKQPVALNSTLRVAARAHSEDMLNQDYFAHRNLLGQGPGDRITSAGYAWSTVGENLAWNGTTGTIDPHQTTEQQHENLFVDREIEGRGHRITMLHPALREVGISIVRGSFTSNGIEYTDSLMQTQEFAASPNSPTFVLGVVYDDLNRNGEYNLGEGRPDATVRLNNLARATNSGGGYVFAVDTPGEYVLTFPSGSRLTLTIDAGDPNIKVDSIDGTRVLVNFGQGGIR
ncbi:MAG: hypothetical protein KF841_04070 [Phycisphaerae bacterium]|nr:hypothetical protein [Phycisphaerae bacterium]